MNLWVPLEMRVFHEKTDVLEKLGKKEIKAEDMAKNVKKDPSLLPEIFNGIFARAYNGC
jgi:hypothetical protein